MFGQLAFWEIATPLLAVFLGAVLSRFYDQRPKILSWILHSGQVELQNDKGEKYVVRTHVLVLRNSGKRAAENVRISHNKLPQFSVFPSVEHEVTTDGAGGGVISIPRMLPNETINFNYLYFPPDHVNEVHSGIRHDEGFASDVRMAPTRQFPTWFNLTLAFAMVIGFATVVYFAFQLAILVFDLVALVR